MDSPTPISVQCRVFGGRRWKGMLALWGATLTATFQVISLAVPGTIAAIIVFGMTVFALRRLAGDATYTLDDTGITRQYASLSGADASTVHWPWANVGTARLKTTSNVEHLEIDSLDGDRWVVTSRQDAEGFARFRDAFLTRMNA